MINGQGAVPAALSYRILLHESALRAIRDLENNELEIIDLHPNPWKAASVLAWITKVLQSLAARHRSAAVMARSGRRAHLA